MNAQRRIVYKKRMDLIDNTKPIEEIINTTFISFIEKSTKPSLANPVVQEITESLKKITKAYL